MLADPRLVAARERLGGALVKAAVARAQELARSGAISPASVADAAAASLPPTAATLTPVINATGVLVHTNLGRAPLSAAARDAVRAAAGCTDVEFDLASGKRGRRGAGALGALARAVPAAGAVHVVNNNAAALALAATALAAGREIIVSRGELIEIGDGFRLPDLLQSTGARIREVGTTNRTTLADYRQAIGADTAFILKVHPSNYLIEGFTASVSVGELAGLGVLVVGDIGSGLLTPNPVLPHEPDADSWLRAGAGLVTASGDKLLGGPQAGLLLGRGGDGHPPRAPSAGPGAAGGQADPGRPRGHPHRPGRAGHPGADGHPGVAQGARRGAGRAAGRRGRRLPGGDDRGRGRRRRRPRRDAAERRAVPARAAGAGAAVGRGGAPRRRAGGRRPDRGRPAAARPARRRARRRRAARGGGARRDSAAARRLVPRRNGPRADGASSPGRD